jgi:REP element-mobilizing transposase RayT
MSIRNAKHPRNGIFFITFTCTKWMNLFEITDSYDLVYNWFNVLKANGHYVFAYIIMPNHLHCMIGLKESDLTVNKIVGNGKRFMAYEIVNRLKEMERMDILNELQLAVSEKDKKRGKSHQVFIESFDCKLCYSEFFIEQKINYIHNNPLSGKWSLSEIPSDYLHSSAGFYHTGRHSIYPVDNLYSRNDLLFI